MRMSILCFALGVWLAQQQAALPDWRALGGLLALAASVVLVVALVRRRQPSHRWPRLLGWGAAALFGFVWAAGLGQWRLADALPVENEGRDIQVIGVISGLPQRFENGVRFEFSVESADAAVPRKLSLAWYRGWRSQHEADDGEAAPSLQAVHAAERWRFTVRLKRPHSNLNPQGYDFEAWLFERGLRATGYIRAGDANQRLDDHVLQFGPLLERLRETLRERIYRALPDKDYAGVLIALVVGDQQAITQDLWQVFSATGITHLMSISGLHITMVASLGWWLVSFAWRRQPRLMLRLPAQKAAALGGWLTALAYCLLAGFGVPAQRTLYMLSVVALALWTGRLTSASRVLALALLVVLLLDPWAVLSAGFWLSFGAVALLFYIGAGRLGTQHWLAEWGRAQWAVTIGMLPALLALFQQFSLVSPLANALAIPLVSLVVTPLALLGALTAAAFGFDAPLWLAHQLLAWMMIFIDWLAQLPLAMWQQHAPPWWAVATATLGCVWLLLPRGFPARWAGLALFAPLLFIAPARPLPGELRLTVLDVGQGLAVHVQTAQHDLLYDTGPQFSPDANSGNRIILPYLRALGVARLDGLVITHQDKDHSGGAQSVIDAMPIDWIASSLSPEDPLRDSGAHLPCYDGQVWEWDGVRFEMLHPLWAAYDNPTRKSNDMGCVLKVSAGEGGNRNSVLLTADIEALSEEALLARHREALRADWLVAPHHGSRTSSTAAFIAAVGAKTVIFPVGYRSRFHHPNADVVRRFEASGAQLWRSDRDGAVTLRLGAAPAQIEREREARRRYWHGG